MSTQLIPASELKTHRLTVFPEKNTPKTFLLTRKAAEQVAEGLNSRNPFIVLAGSAQAYPKYGAVLEEIGREERQQMGRGFVDFWDERLLGTVVVEGVPHGLYARRLVRRMRDRREEILSEERGYWSEGKFILYTGELK